MEIKTAKFVISNTDVSKCPNPTMPEYAFIGRSNVGKSSLINSMTNIKGLAKISGRPGKTQLINHFLINDNWYLVDLPGYGYAKISKSQREKWQKFIEKYILTRQNLMNVFVLLDSRHKPQQIDMEFMQWLGEHGIPFSMVFTKVDKLNTSEKSKFLPAYKKEMLQIWEEMPPHFVTSSVSNEGTEELLNYIDEVNPYFEYQG
ncbi:ribosome biogenesis GTP-binding protein YihA/YsxC [Paracrocinitomix mangrovi]|uniref:ribosome biogenesis GTP-binding protein YihA/YsxC n=1 Tax=Paracrocinitomix mangrovi TaxID=2862509 RepID=UPI001C8D8328|nr:ribosome biogenesis GTP-binding protein YihA/YsxC [Paracrocinitomix mangrovi]UKN03497.1 ribosome biogenesis GTP-binding protein YihA/YsxC [Paracrocinitomix mangrovi]